MTKVITSLEALNLEISTDMHLVIYFKELIGDFIANISICAGKKLHLEHIILGGKTNCKLNFTLAEGAELIQHTGFKLKNDNFLSYDYSAEHLGAKSKSELQIIGSLDGSAKKQSDLKIHFAKGAIGAIGSERENISLFSNKAQNIAIPCILSDESEAEGHHGFSSSHISDDKLEYLQSRGIDFDKIKAILAKNNLLRVAKLTKQADIIEEIYGY